MKRSRYTEEQIAFTVKQAELGIPVPEVCHKMGILDATFYAWRTFLCCTGHASGRCYKHRHHWIVDRVRLLSSIFDIC